MSFKRNSVRHRSWFTSKWFLIMVLIIFVLVTIALAKEFYRSHQINKEIAQLQDEIQELEGKNSDFSQFVEFLKTDVYLEEQARIKLGMKAPGEKVVVLKENASEFVQGAEGDTKSFVNSSGQIEKSKSKNSSNWWSYFWKVQS
jgi:cell division protein FtsB